MSSFDLLMEGVRSAGITRTSLIKEVDKMSRYFCPARSLLPSRFNLNHFSLKKLKKKKCHQISNYWISFQVPSAVSWFSISKSACFRRLLFIFAKKHAILYKATHNVRCQKAVLQTMLSANGDSIHLLTCISDFCCCCCCFSFLNFWMAAQKNLKRMERRKKYKKKSAKINRIQRKKKSSREALSYQLMHHWAINYK